MNELLRERDLINQKALQIAVKETAISKAWVIDMLKENVDRAMAVKPVLDREGNETGVYDWNGHVANKALELLGREIGMFVERHELTLAQKLADMPEDQRGAEMFELVERARERLRQLRQQRLKCWKASSTSLCACRKVGRHYVFRVEHVSVGR